MKDSIGILVFEAVTTGLIVWAGLSGKRILLIDGPRSAVITLGIIGMVILCTISRGKFISAAPAHPLTIAGYILGGIALLVFATQLFKWRIPILNDPAKALWMMAGIIIIKGIIARIGHAILDFPVG